ncbi:MAG: class I adenylate-forming enzyme family protein [Comamonas sp.]|uniref:class I adenylate-forming enzyme family protein n=1 Tax=Comamonas sp. TaxID=34028 RepID=UPI002FC71AB3
MNALPIQQTTPETVAQALAQTVAAYPDKTAYIDQGRSYSWQQVDAMAEAWAHSLFAQGLRRGDRIGIILPNGLPWILTYLAAAKMGAVVVGLSVRYRSTELDFMLQDSAIKAVLAPREMAGFDYVAYLDQARQRFESLQHLLWVDAGLEQQLQATHESSGYGEGAQPDDLLMIIYTSGTTGRPKAAGLTHRSQLGSALAQCSHVCASADDLVQLAMPLNHVGGITCGLLTMLLAGGTCELVPMFSPEVVLQMAQRHPPTWLVGVPTMLTLLLMHPLLPETDLSQLRLIVVGGSNVEPALLSRIQQLFPGVAIMNLYGLSETSGAIVMTPWQASQEALLQSIGKPLAGAEMRVAGVDGAALPPGEVGELWFRGAGVIERYVGQQQDANAFAGGWLHSGDLGFVDEQGLIYLKGRQKDMFIQGGFNVYPSEVEAVIASYPGVMMVAGIGVADPVLGEVGRYYVVGRPGVVLKEAELLAHCSQHLADYKVPRQLVLRAELPLTPAGKIQKALLRAEG